MKHEIRIYKKELFYDIDSLTYKYAVLNDTGVAGNYAAQTDDSELDRSILTRMMDHRDADVRMLLQRRLSDVGIQHADDVPSMKDEFYSYVLEMPASWPSSLLVPLARCIHEYIVHGTLKEYYQSNSPRLNPRNIADTDDLKMKISHMAKTRKGAVKRPLQPF